MADQDSVMDSPRKKVAYDPDQDPEEKRVLRQKYRVLLKDEEGHQFNVNGYTTLELLEKVQLADSLFDQGTVIAIAHLSVMNPSRPFPRFQCRRHKKRLSILPFSSPRPTCTRPKRAR